MSEDRKNKFDHLPEDVRGRALFGSNVKYLLHSLRKEKTEMATALGYGNYKEIRKWAEGRENAPIEFLIKISNYLGFSIEQLFKVDLDFENTATISCDINPLKYKLEVRSFGHIKKEELNPEAIISMMCRRDEGDKMDAVYERYLKIVELDKVFLVPDVAPLLEKIVWSLKDAKSCYILGNYFGCISICGMVSEMIATFWYEVINTTVDLPWDDDKQERIFGTRIEEISQKRCIDILYGLDWIDKTWYDSFNKVRVFRNEYLHKFSASWENIGVDALTCYKETNTILKNLIDDKVRNGVLSFNVQLTIYLKKNGYWQMK